MGEGRAPHEKGVRLFHGNPGWGYWRYARCLYKQPSCRANPVSFTYTFPATLYVNVGWGLPHRADATAGTNVQNPAILPLPLWGRVGLPMKKASAFFMGTRGGVTGGTPGVYINNPPAAPTLFRLHTPSPLRVCKRRVGLAPPRATRLREQTCKIPPFCPLPRRTRSVRSGGGLGRG